MKAQTINSGTIDLSGERKMAKAILHRAVEEAKLGIWDAIEFISRESYELKLYCSLVGLEVKEFLALSSSLVPEGRRRHRCHGCRQVKHVSFFYVEKRTGNPRNNCKKCSRRKKIKCARCSKIKSPERYYRRSDTKGLYNECKTCFNKRRKKYGRRRKNDSRR